VKQNRKNKGNLKKTLKKYWKTFSCIVLAAIVTWLVVKPLDYVAGAFPQIQNRFSEFFASKPRIEIKRSTFNNMFTLAKSSEQKDSIIVNGANTTHRLIVKITNTSDEELRINSFEVYDREKEELLFVKGVENGEALIITSKTKEFEVESPSLLGKDNIVRAIESGKLKLVVKSNFGSLTLPINCICFYNGQIFSNGKHLYSLGSDSNCLKFEYNDPEGAKASGLIPANEFLN
jgi:hypothetical protein